RTLPAARAARARVGPAAVDVGLAVVPDGVGAGRGLTDVGRADAVLAVTGVAARFAVGAPRAQVHAAAIDVGLGAVGEAVAAGRLREADAALARTALAVAVAGAGLPRRAAVARRGTAAVDVRLSLVPDVIHAVRRHHLRGLRLTGAADGHDAGAGDLEVQVAAGRHARECDVRRAVNTVAARGLSRKKTGRQRHGSSPGLCRRKPYRKARGWTCTARSRLSPAPRWASDAS